MVIATGKSCTYVFPAATNATSLQSKPNDPSSSRNTTQIRLAAGIIPIGCSSDRAQ